MSQNLVPLENMTVTVKNMEGEEVLSFNGIDLVAIVMGTTHPNGKGCELKGTVAGRVDTRLAAGLIGNLFGLSKRLVANTRETMLTQAEKAVEEGNELYACELLMDLSQFSDEIEHAVKQWRDNSVESDPSFTEEHIVF